MKKKDMERKKNREKSDSTEKKEKKTYGRERQEDKTIWKRKKKSARCECVEGTGMSDHYLVVGKLRVNEDKL